MTGAPTPACTRLTDEQLEQALETLERASDLAWRWSHRLMHVVVEPDEEDGGFVAALVDASKGGRQLPHKAKTRGLALKALVAWLAEHVTESAEKDAQAVAVARGSLGL